MEDNNSISIKLIVRVESKEHRFTLEPRHRLRLGRADDADVKIDHKSVSSYHLELAWSGEELFIKDLESSNGTFRLPQDSPFKEAQFPLRMKSLKFRLSSFQIELSWEPDSPGNLEVTSLAASGGKTSRLERTRLAQTRELAIEKEFEQEVEKDAEKEVEKEAVAPSKAAPSRKLETRPATGPVTLEVKANPKLKTKTEVRPSPAVSSSATPSVATIELSLPLATSIWLGLGASFCLLASVLWGIFCLQGVAHAPRVLLHTGGMVDVLLLWARLWLQKWPALLGGLALLIVVASILRRRSLSKNISLTRKWAQALARLGFTSTVTVQFFTALALILSLTWPAVVGLFFGVNVAAWPAAFRFWNLVFAPSPPAERVQNLRALIPPLMGSSLLYKELFAAERDRVVGECGGVGSEAPWESKKICLILISAVGIETLEDLHPALLGDVAARMAILLSLDGITRVLSTEGAQAPTIPFFLNSLDAAGLDREKEDIAKLMLASPSEGAGMENSLRDLRHRIEIRLDARQRELSYPANFYLQVPGPLETGI